MQALTFGSGLATSTSATLSELPPDGLALGTKCWNIDVGAYFVLTASTADLDTDVVVAVSGLTGVRWIIDSVPQVVSEMQWTVVTVTGSNAQNVDITFDGETAGCIEIVGVVQNNNASASTMTVQPNQLTTNQKSQEVEGTPASNNPSASGFETALATFAFAGGGGGYAIFHLKMFTKTGTLRPIFYEYLNLDNASAILNNAAGGAVWTDTSTAMTNIRLHSNRSDGFKIGSVIRWRIIPDAA